MIDAAKKPKPAPPFVSPWNVGDWVYAIFWREFMVGGRDRGSWTVIQVRVISAGPSFICCDLDGTQHPTGAGSPFYFAAVADVFADNESAMVATRERTPPASPVSSNGSATWPAM